MEGLNHKAHFNPWVEAEFGESNVIAVKFALGAQPIFRWYKNWNPELVDFPFVKGDLYDVLMEEVFRQIEGEDIASVTFIWMQGERDALLGLADFYGESLTGLYRQISTDLNRDDINFVIGRLSDFDMENQLYQDWTKVRAVQMEIADSHERYVWVDTDDLNDGVNGYGMPVENDLHMSVDGYAELGRRFAEAAIKMIRLDKD